MVKPRVSGMEVWFLDVGQGTEFSFVQGRQRVLTDRGSASIKVWGKTDWSRFKE